MADEWKSDWEKLLAKCAADQDYRAELSKALQQGAGDKIETLLKNIDVAVSVGRIDALKAAYPTMDAVRAQFEPPGLEARLVAAP